MGCTTSNNYKVDDTSTENTHGKDHYTHHTKSATESKLHQALLKKKQDNLKLEKPFTLEKILLKFDKLRVVLGYVREQFDLVAVDGSLTHEGLENAMKKLNVNMSLEDILDLFDFVNIQERKNITIKEFLVALTIGMVLEVIPAFADTPADKLSSRPAASPAKRTFSVFMGHNHEIKEMLNLIVSAYLIFDKQAKGYIEHDGIETMLEEHGHKHGNNAMLSAQRWNEMDWDGNGTIDFAEFLYSFTSWVDIDEE